MKKFIIYFFTLCIILLSIMNPPMIHATSNANSGTNNTYWPKEPSLFAESAILMEASTGLILYEKNIYEQHYPASITKIMTGLVALENSQLNDVITFSREAIFGVDLDSSRIGIDVGEQLTMRQALYGMLLESANEVSYGIAEHVAGNVEGFSKLMNQKAAEIGCLNTNFTNPHGLHDNEHKTTAYDMALITREAMKNETFRKIFSTRTYQIPPTNKQKDIRYLRNHHRFVLRQNYLYNDCIGGKTGYTSVAKYSLVSVAKRGDLELIAVVMRDDSTPHQYEDTQKLFDYGFDNFTIYSIADMDKNKYIDESILFTRFSPLLDQSSSPIKIDTTGHLVLPNNVPLDTANKKIEFSSLDNSIVGKISYHYNDKFVGNANIMYHNNNDIILKQEYLNTNVNSLDNIDATENLNNNRSTPKIKPIFVILIVTISIIVLLALLYLFIYELPRIKRRKAYYRKRKTRRSEFEDFKL